VPISGSPVCSSAIQITGDRISRAPAPAAAAATAYLIPTLMLYFIDTFPDRFLRMCALADGLNYFISPLLCCWSVLWVRTPHLRAG
jgi:hypothetical protein